MSERPSVDWTYWKHHLIGCVDCTAGDVCAEGQRILGTSQPNDAPWLKQRPSAERRGALRRFAEAYQPREPWMLELCDELDAVTRERDGALAALTTIAFATDCLDTSPDEIAKHVIGFAGAYGLEREHNESDSRRIDFLQSIMTPKDGYVEVYLAGLRRGHADADMYQVEFQPLTQRVVTGPTLREAIDAAIAAALGGAP